MAGKIKKLLENELVGGTQSTDVYPVTSVKAVYDEDNERLDNIINRRGIVNISTNYNSDHIAEVYTLEQAIAKVPSKDRVLGFQGKFLTSEGWKSYIFTGDSLSNWSDISKWIEQISSAVLAQELGNSTSKAISQKAVTEAITNTINLTDIDFDEGLIAQIMFAKSSCRFLVTSNSSTMEDVSVGILDCFSDNMAHMLTQVFTTHYTLPLDGGHTDDKIYKYWRSYHFQGGTSSIPTGTWGEWKQVYSSDNQKDVDALKTSVNNLNANTGIDEYEDFSDQKKYKAGTTVNKDGLLYTFITDHAAGAWTGNDVEETNIKDDLLNAIYPLNYIITKNGYYNTSGGFVSNEGYRTSDALIRLNPYKKLTLKCFLYNSIYAINVFSSADEWKNYYESSKGSNSLSTYVFENNTEEDVYLRCSWVKNYEHSIVIEDNAKGLSSVITPKVNNLSDDVNNLSKFVGILDNVTVVGGYYTSSGSYNSNSSYKTTEDLIEVKPHYSLTLRYCLYSSVFGINFFNKEGTWLSNYPDSEGVSDASVKEVTYSNDTGESVFVKCAYLGGREHSIRLFYSNVYIEQKVQDIGKKVDDNKASVDKDIEKLNSILSKTTTEVITNNGTVIGTADGEDKYLANWGSPEYIMVNSNYIFEEVKKITALSVTVSQTTDINIYSVKDNGDNVVCEKLATVSAVKTSDEQFEDLEIDGLNFTLPANTHLGINAAVAQSVARVSSTTINNYGGFRVNTDGTSKTDYGSITKVRYGFTAETQSFFNLKEMQEQINEIQNGGFEQIRILSFGNSYARDAFSYVPWILENINPKIKITIGILYSGACTIQTHLARINSGAEEYVYWKFANGAWTQKNSSSWDALEDEQWDIITIQEHSLASLQGWETKTKPYINPLIMGIINRLNYNVQFAWCLTHTYAIGYEESGHRVENEEEQKTMYENLVNMSEWIMNNCPVKILIPWGTATQNAKGTSLNSLGDFGNGMSNDGLHLQEGIGCLIEAYTTILSIFDVLIQKYGIIGDNTQLDTEKITNKDTSYAIGGHIGTGVIGLNENNIRIGQICAVMANNYPTKISDIKSIINEI